MTDRISITIKVLEIFHLNGITLSITVDLIIGILIIILNINETNCIIKTKKMNIIVNIHTLGEGFICNFHIDLRPETN